MKKLLKKFLHQLTKHRILAALAIFLLTLAGFVLCIVAYKKLTPPIDSSTNAQQKTLQETEKTYHVTEPEIVKGIYLTANTAGIYRFDELLELVKTTELNTMVMDVQDSKGYLAFKTTDASLSELQKKTVLINDLEKLIEKAHNNDIYLIARVVVFQNQALVEARPEWAVKNQTGGVWKDYKGITWLDAACEEIWDINVKLAKELYERGFDEINFDYIRFPSDGNLSQIAYSCFKGQDKAQIIESFFKYLNNNLKDIPVSADLFGQTCCNLDDINIGQKVINAYENLDAVCQMMYPSHYYTNFVGFKNPAEHPYEVIKYSLDKTFEKLDEYIEATSSTPRNLPIRNTRVRPWIQAFSLGAIYTPEMIRKQMDAIYDTPNTGGWLLWNARNVYNVNIFLKE